MKKKLFNLICLFSTVLVTLTLSSCGGGDDDGGGNAPYRVVDGVNVPTGKKLTKLTTAKGKYYWYDKYSFSIIETRNEPEHNFEIKYDEKGRLKNIYDDDGLLATIDYNLMSIKLNYNHHRNYKIEYSFSLNNEGYISRVGPCILKYDSNGMLYDVKDLYNFSTLTYDDGDMIKSFVKSLASQKESNIYVAYEKTSSPNNYIMHISSEQENWRPLIMEYAIKLIAYQSGLFGRISSTMNLIRNEDNTKITIKYKDDINNYNINASLTFE